MAKVRKIKAYRVYVLRNIYYRLRKRTEMLSNITEMTQRLLQNRNKYAKELQYFSGSVENTGFVPVPSY